MILDAIQARVRRSLLDETRQCYASEEDRLDAASAAVVADLRDAGMLTDRR